MNTLPSPELEATANPMSPEALLQAVREPLRRWALEDTERVRTATAPASQAEGCRSGTGAASTVPYVLEGIARRA